MVLALSLTQSGAGHDGRKRQVKRHRSGSEMGTRKRRATIAPQMVNGRCLENVATGPSVKRFGVCVDGIPALIVAWKFT